MRKDPQVARLVPEEEHLGSRVGGPPNVRIRRLLVKEAQVLLEYGSVPAKASVTNHGSVAAVDGQMRPMHNQVVGAHLDGTHAIQAARRDPAARHFNIPIEGKKEMKRLDKRESGEGARSTHFSPLLPNCTERPENRVPQDSECL